MKNLRATFLLSLIIACRAGATTPFDEAENGIMGRDQRRVRELYVKAADSDRDAKKRDQARIRAARLDWYVFRDPAAARTRLAGVAGSSAEASAAHAERAMLETELAHDFDAARKAADLAYAAAKTPADRDRALTLHAAAAVEQARLERERGDCPERTRLAAAIAKLQTAIAGSGPTVDRARLLLDAALLAHDDASALQAWRWYYVELPSLVPEAIADRRAAGLALATARLFAEAEMVLSDPCVARPIPKDATVLDVLAYAASMKRTAALADEHHRTVAAGTSDDKSFTNALGAEGEALWRALSWPSTPPAYSQDALLRELSSRFGTVIALGKTEGTFTLVLGHRVADETRVVEQHGRRGSLHFVELDGMIAGGYATWVTHGRTGTGGWIGDDAVYQIRPMYVDGPLTLWSRITDPVERARADEDIARETKLDQERAKAKEVVALPGLGLRLRRQYGDALRSRLEKEGLQGGALRDAFLRTAAADKLASSIWAHEGRHSIDKALGISKNVELEFRAKLSEVVFAPAPRASMGSILSPVGGKGAHAEANERVLEGIAQWIRAHVDAIAGYDANAPGLTQLDRLTDEQIREAFRSLDPLIH